MAPFLQAAIEVVNERGMRKGMKACDRRRLLAATVNHLVPAPFVARPFEGPIEDWRLLQQLLEYFPNFAF